MRDWDEVDPDRSEVRYCGCVVDYFEGRKFRFYPCVAHAEKFYSLIMTNKNQHGQEDSIWVDEEGRAWNMRGELIK